MKALFLLLILGFSNNIYSDVKYLSIDKCIKEGKSFGNGKGHNLINNQCFSLAKSYGRSQNHWEDGNITASALPNILFVKYKNTPKTIMISGKNSLLTNITSIDVNPIKNQILAVSENNLLTFDMKNEGNVQALYTLTLPLDLKPQFVQFGKDYQNVTAFFIKEKLVKQYKRMASIYGRRTENATTPILELKIDFKNPIDIKIDKSSGFIYVLGSDTVDVFEILDEKITRIDYFPIQNDNSLIPSSLKIKNNLLLIYGENSTLIMKKNLK